LGILLFLPQIKKYLVFMLILLSPAKTLDFESPAITDMVSEPDFAAESEILIKKLSTFSVAELSELMDISSALAELTFERYQTLHRHRADVLSKQAILTYIGEAFRGLNAASMNDDDFEYAQSHLRILSGMYGVLRPLDIIQPHRLEMATKLNIGKLTNLYQFWGDKITSKLNEDLTGNDYVINLASNEYFKSVKTEKLKAQVITPTFKDLHKGTYKILVLYAKNARGAMTSFIIKNRISNPEDIKSFNLNGYRFKPELSDVGNWVWTRG
jgi:cytoplasmic iron level regulating protein YaaA (DUF328/UPF0246 family)